jgi:integrase
MPSAKAVLKKDYKSKDETYPLKIRLQSGNFIKYHNTGYKLKEKFFADGLVKKHPDADIINGITSDLINQAKKYFADCALNGRPVNLEKVFTKQTSANFSDYILHRADQYKEKGKIIMWQKLTRYEKEVKECFGKLFLDEIDSDKLRMLENYLIKNGNKPNTVAKKFSILRQMFTAAAKENHYLDLNPFSDYKIQTFPAKKEKLSLQQIQAIENLDLTGPYNDARNLFLFSYYSKGARFENCIFLERKNIIGGRIYFETNKGHKNLSVLITSKLQKILDQYPTGQYVFPYIKETPADEFVYRSVKDSANTLVNRYLKVVTGLAKITIPVTFHQARHSIAYHLKKAKVETNFIQDVLGHSSSRTTEIYLKSLDDESLDEEMKKVYGD